jgi:alkaline phosphatase D
MFDLARIPEAVRYEGGVSRRLFLAYGAALSALPLVGSRAEGRTLLNARFSDNPFSVGVASGEPGPIGFVLWTRLAPLPLEGGGMTDEVVEVRWEVAEDESFKQVVRSGVALATPQLAHSVHVEVDGLSADRWYFYRFHAGDATSPVGRGRTTPPAEKLAERLKFAFVSCQHYEQGLYTGYQHMAGEQLDLVVHLGDYIYEGAANPKAFRPHVGGKLLTLADARAVPLDRRLGRSRAGKQLGGGHLRTQGRRSGGLSPAARERVSGLLRDDAAASGVCSPRSGHEDLSHDFVRPPRHVPGARHAAIPQRPAERCERVRPDG